MKFDYDIPRQHAHHTEENKKVPLLLFKVCLEPQINHPPSSFSNLRNNINMTKNLEDLIIFKGMEYTAFNQKVIKDASARSSLLPLFALLQFAVFNGIAERELSVKYKKWSLMQFE
jgi:hypothetical protein